MTKHAKKDDALAHAHSQRVAQHILACIQQQGGRIPFSQFMQLALYAPGLGYYMAGQSRLGRGGDFVTAPLLSPLFGQTIAESLREPVQELGVVFEIGAGTGELAVQLLQTWQQLGCLPKQYFILELSPDLQQRQQQYIQDKLPELTHCIHWLSSLPEAAWQGVIIANEVLDALPVERFRITDQQTIEQAYVRDNSSLMLEYAPPEPALQAWYRDTLQDIWPLPSGYTGEVCLWLAPWLKSITEHWQRGVALFFDYGDVRQMHYHQERSQGTLRCYYQHQWHEDPLQWPGLQDITADVDFTALAEAADALNLAILGFTTQADFLLECGLLKRMEALDLDAYHERAAAHTLLMPQEMGERIKVMALGRNYERPLLGWSRGDRRHRL